MVILNNMFIVFFFKKLHYSHMFIHMVYGETFMILVQIWNIVVQTFQTEELKEA